MRLNFWLEMAWHAFSAILFVCGFVAAMRLEIPAADSPRRLAATIIVVLCVVAFAGNALMAATTIRDRREGNS